MFAPPIYSYFRQLSASLDSVRGDAVAAATALLLTTYKRGGTIYVIGNGQSATTATAFALDLTKQSITAPDQRRVRIVSLTDNIAALTAWANDVGYEVVFTEQLKSLWRSGDMLLAISVSGSSPNIVHACRWVREQHGMVAALAGVDGGVMQTEADVCMVVPSRDYGIVETAHVAILHYWVDVFRSCLAK